jgi:DNA-binding protein HU-beta
MRSKGKRLESAPEARPIPIADLIDTKWVGGFNLTTEPWRGRGMAGRFGNGFPVLLSAGCDQHLPENEGIPVNKTELIEHIAKHADISKAAATRALDSMVGAVKTTLRKGGSVSLVGFGTFAVGKRAARSGRNPRTGATIKIKAAKVPKFRPGKALKDALN